jgi:hypothetical protein
MTGAEKSFAVIPRKILASLLAYSPPSTTPKPADLCKSTPPYTARKIDTVASRTVLLAAKFCYAKARTLDVAAQHNTPYSYPSFFIG